MMDYIARYGLEFNPFIKNSKEIMVDTGECREAVFRLNYLLGTKGFGVLTGDAGQGKTTVLRNWVAGLNPSLCKAVYIGLSTLTVMEFYRHLAAELGLAPAYRKSDNFRLIQGEVNRLALEKKKTPVIILDEANYLGAGILNDLKIIFNFEMDSRDRAVVVLAGQPQLNNTLRLAVHEPLRQRVVMNYHLEGLGKEEGGRYIAAKLKGAGCAGAVFDEGAIQAILNAANGAPRVIDKLCNASMVIGNSKNAGIIDADCIMQAVNDGELG
jgi:type II secretory pathway predicted ATPase ExeA